MYGYNSYIRSYSNYVTSYCIVSMHSVGYSYNCMVAKIITIRACIYTVLHLLKLLK